MATHRATSAPPLARPALLLFAAIARADFLLSAGNWTHSTNLFANYHFMPGVNEAGEWDLMTGGNWTPTNHSDATLVGDAEIYLCPCPEPPCDADPEPVKPGYTSTVFACLEQESLNVSHAVCTTFHAERTNVTCVTPSHVISCDVPGFDSNHSLLKWWDNEEAPSRSFFSGNVTAVSCIASELGGRPLPVELRNLTDMRAVQEALSIERCEVVCRRVCRTVCMTDHLSVHALFPELNDWQFDPRIDNNPREFIANGTLFQERMPTQYLRGVGPDTLGQERVPLNITCSMPTMTPEAHDAIMGAPPRNLTGQQGLFDMFGRRLNAMNVFDLALYVALHTLGPLEGKTCVTPFPNASMLPPLPEENEPYFHALVCHEPLLAPYNFSAYDDWQEWAEGNGSEWDWHHAEAVRTARGDAHWEKRWRALQRRPPRRRQLHHEFEIARSSWDYWLDESPFERESRLIREHAERTGDCRFYHNCTDPLPPPLLLHVFQCWLPNATLQPNVSTIPPRSLSSRPRLHGVNENTTYGLHQVSCIRPSWPNASGISCLTHRSGLFCPFTDTYRGNETALDASGEEYLNETTVRCTSWPLLDVYRHVADRGLLFRVPPNRTRAKSYLDPWERPCDVYVRVTTGQHHYCTIDEHDVLRCTGHNPDGRASLDWVVDADLASYGLEADVELSVQAKAALDTANDELEKGLRYETPEEAAARVVETVESYAPGRTLDMCAGMFHTCAIEETVDRASGNITGTRLRCWGSNYSDAIHLPNMQVLLDFNPTRGGPRRVECGKRFVCALQPTEATVETGPGPAAMASKNWHVFCSGIAQDRQGMDGLLPTAMWQTEITPFTDFKAGGGEHACGIRDYQLLCYGNFPPIPPDVIARVVGMSLGPGHTCIGNVDGTARCFSGSQSEGKEDDEWLTEIVGSPTAYGMTGGGWPSILSISLGETVACVLDYEGQAYCGGVRNQVELALMRPPLKLQPERTDLVERGVTFSSLSCGGQAARNGSLVQLGEQYCCGLTHASVVHCWGKPPPHNGFRMPREDINPSGTRTTLVPLGTFVPLNESNASVYHVRNRRCIGRRRYLRDFGLRLLLDTHPAISFSDATTNFSKLYTCFDAPRRYTVNASLNAITWLGVNITNTSQLYQQRSWHSTMLLTLSLASYADGLSCFNFTFPFRQLHCAPMLRYINRTVAVVMEATKPFTIERISATEAFTTKFTLAHTTQPDNYCFEKLRLTPSEQFKRGGAWHRATQRVVDGFEIVFAFQITEAARLCKTVRALVTGTLLYERCMHTGSDGLSLVLRGGGPPTALGGGGGQLGYGGLNRTLAIEFDTWHNADMGDLYYNHVSVQTGGPNGPVGAHKENYLSAAIVDPAAYPTGLADGKAHIVRVRYTPGFDAEMLKQGGPASSPQNLKYWIEEGPIAANTYPHAAAVGSWKREGTGMLAVYLDAVDKPLLVLPIDLGYTLGLTDGRAWAGFTAATGRRFQTHYVLSWQFCEGPDGCAKPMTACEAVGCNPMFPSARYDVPADADPRYRDLQAGVPPATRERSVIDLSQAGDAEQMAKRMEYSGARYESDGNEVQWQPTQDEPEESTWGGEPEGWQLQLSRPEEEDVLRGLTDYYAKTSGAGLEAEDPPEFYGFNKLDGQPRLSSQLG